MARHRYIATHLAGMLAACAVAGAAHADPDMLRQRQLEHLLRQDCGSCHGLRLTGGLGPPLTREALAGKPRELLIATITLGRPGTPMPNWDALLDTQDIAWLADRLLQGNPPP
ncbi:c-type cytochrome [Bordetella petrii]|uniref:Probable c-type cytochrome n=1 Tax=Bordetella petrii (strain ATCC BAA-461 / DSM 12804 / CCUG 43448 / CIP 107267 / Se-1111R) TaxID=340100 RepID=A9I7F4_BORPD|nr:cytochrome c [Bordetella petrii]CAP44405.1 probable c-type cytochrome precursor [Bordetella petrii]